ncbi:MAG TPA: DUF5652 family protein [bacterium]|nr:DUF5652 family protein [bacterium]
MQQPIDLLTNPPILFLVIIWTLSWKGVALWKAAQNKQKGWFVAILVINSIGILEIAYLLLDKAQHKKMGNNQCDKCTEKGSLENLNSESN